MGAQVLAELCLELEMSGRSDCVERADGQLARLEAEYNGVQQALAAQRHASAATPERVLSTA
jgi:hypothetical protein